MPISSNRRQRVIEFATPKVADLVVVERVDASKNVNSAATADDAADVYGNFGAAHPDTTRFPNFKLALIKNGDNDQGQYQDWYYVKDRADQDDYNWEFQAAGAGSPRFNTVVRTYVLPRFGSGTDGALAVGQTGGIHVFDESLPALASAMPTTTNDPFGDCLGDDSPNTDASYILFEKKQVRSGDETLDSLFVVEQRIYVKRVTIRSIDTDQEFPYDVGEGGTTLPIGNALISKETLFHKDEAVKATTLFLDTNVSGGDEEGVQDVTTTVTKVGTNDITSHAEYVFSNNSVTYKVDGTSEEKAFWGVDELGIMREGKQLSDNWYALFERQVIKVGTNGIVAQYNTTKNMSWPAVFSTLYTQKWPRRDGTSQLILYPVFKRESYDGPTPMLIENYWRKAPFDAPDSVGGAHTKLAQIKPMEPMAMSYTTPMFSVNVKKCLHGEESLIYTTGTDDAVWDYIEYTANWKKTNYDDWPKTIVISDDQRPFRGGYLRTKVTAYRPETGRADADFDSDFGVVPVSQKPADE